MSSTTEKLAETPIERWVKKVEFLSSASLEDLGDHSLSLTTYTTEEMSEMEDRKLLAKRSKPSYQWQIDEHDKWWRVWFQESNLTIQIDLHFSDGEHQMNMYEIDLEQCQTSTSFLDWLYRSTLNKQWSCPEMLWALMEVADEASEKQFGKSLTEAYSKYKTLDWAKPKL
ncbi:hypothetical protein [Phormidesmis sp. 146-33]